LVAKKQQIGPNVRLMVPKTHGGRWIRDGLARLPILRAMTTAERLLRAKAPRPLPEYAPAR
jgi:hypothetical protein